MHTREALRIIQEMANTGRPVVSSGRAVEQNRVFTFVAKGLEGRPIDYFEGFDEAEGICHKINSKTVVGKYSRHPITLELPVLAAGMSYGALSLEAKKAISKGTALAGTADNTGEGGMYPEERELAKILIVQYSTARFGVTEEYLKAGDAIEIKIGQGAKPGQGGLLPAAKVTESIARTRSTPEKEVLPGHTLHSPAYHPDIATIEDLKERVEWLRELTDGKPIIIKLGAGDIETDLAYALKVDPDVIAIDGREGATAASPRVMIDGVGIPAFPALVRARRFLDGVNWEELGVRKPELWIAGGFNLGEEVAAALALGADAVFLGLPLMIAMGCSYCQRCHLGECPVGIASQIEDPKVREEKKIKQLDVEEAAQKVANYLKALTEEVKMIAGICGLEDVHKLKEVKEKHLRAFDPYIASKVGIKTVWDA